MQKIKEFLSLVRIEHALMLAIAVLIAEIITLQAFPPLNLLLALSLIVPIFNEMASFALNDYLDIESDKINKKTDRPLVRGTLSPNFALATAAISYIISLAAGFLINTPAFAIVLIYTLFSILYNYKLKDTILMGNIFIATTMAVPFLFGNLVYSNSISPITYTLMAIAFLSGLAREIVKTIQDMQGDREARGARTLPFAIGITNSAYIASFLYILFIPLTFLAFMQGLTLTPLSGGLVLFADIGILYIAIKLPFSQDEKFLKNCRKISLASLFIGLIGLLAGAL